MSIDANNELLGYLRQETRFHHRRIEQQMGLDGDFSLLRYIRVLQAFEAFLGVWEPAVSQLLAQEDRGWFWARSRTVLARSDLLALGASCRSDLLIRFEAPVASPAFAYGAMYVIEGSALGGQIIAERVRRLHGVDRHKGASFFAGRGGQTGAMWREFRLRFSERIHPSDANYAQARAGAIATFTGLTSVADALLSDS